MHGDIHRWAVARGITPYHPSDWSPEDRAEYALAFDWSAPYSDVYRHCPCHPHGFARGLEDEVSDAELAGFIADKPMTRGRLSRETAKALAYIERWSYAYLGSRQAAARQRVLDAMGRR